MKNKPVILVVDDQIQNIELLEAHLVTQGYEIIQAESGGEALEKLSGNQVDLVLLDVVMPGMSGFEVLAKLRADKKTERIPVIMITAHKEHENRLKALESGCDDFISKPFDKHELLARVRSLLRIKFLNDEADEAHEFDESVINTIREPLIALDQDLRVVLVSRSFYEVFKVKPEETVGQLIYDLGNKQWDIPKLRDLLETILPQKTTLDNYEVEHDFAGIGRRVMLLNARQLRRVWGKERIILLAIEDITERKRLEALLAESELQYRRLFETASDGIVLLEKSKGQIIHANPAAGKMLGYSEEESIGKKLQDIGVSLDMSDFPAIMKSLNRSGILNYEDVPVKTKSGQYIDTDIYLVDRAKLAQCNIRDVTERKRTAEILKEEKRFIENAFNSLQDIFFVFDLEERFLRWNKTMNVVTGYLDSEINLMKASVFFQKDDQKRISEAIWEAIREGSASVDAIVVTKEGKQIPYAFNISLLRDVHGNPVGISGVGRDITEHRKADEMIERLHHQNALILESVSDGIYGIDLNGNTTFINSSAEKMTGWKTGELVGKRLHDILHHSKSDGTPYPSEDCPIYGTLKDGAIHHIVDEVFWRKDGSSFPVEYTSTPIVEEGKLAGAVVVFRDITEQRKLESQLRHAQKMEAVGTLAGGIAHDFNNILNVIIGYGTMVMDRIGDDQLSREQMNEVLTAADRAANLTKRLLVFSRKQVVEVKPVNINELILGLQKMLVRIITESIEIDLNLADRHLVVMADAGQIEQVLINLAANARDAMPEGGRLTIGAGLQELDDEYVAAYGYGKPGMYVLITVADTGQGMDAETQKKIFEPFFTTKGIGEGTGLGLAISYGIIKQHNGYIKAYSEIGKGTTFKIWLPVIEDIAENKPEAVSLSYPQGGKETILVAEDDAALRKLSRIVLESYGYSVITAEDGEDAITKFMENRERINLVLLDMIMPKKNGKEVCEVIIKKSPGIKILFASGYTMDIIKTRELTEAGFDFILKPVVPRDLLRKVREVLDGNKT